MVAVVQGKMTFRHTNASIGKKFNVPSNAPMFLPAWIRQRRV